MINLSWEEDYTSKYPCPCGKGEYAVTTVLAEHLQVKQQYRGGINRLFIVGDWKVQLNDSIVPEAKEGEADEGYKVEVEFDSLNTDVIEKLIEAGAITNKSCRLTVTIEASGHTDKTKDNLQKIFESKKEIIFKALGTEDGRIEFAEDKIIFKLFRTILDAEKINAYEQFCTLLNQLALNSKSASSKKTETDNDKFTFRVFLIRLGMIGDEYKAARKILLENLEGNAAFRSGSKSEKVTEVITE